MEVSLLYIAAILYLIPVFSLLLFPLRKYLKFGGVHAFFGRIEWALSFLRDSVFAPLALAAGLYKILWPVMTKTGLPPPLSFIYFAPAVLTVWNFHYRRRRVRAFLGFIFEKRILEPSEFFKLYYSSVSGLPGRLPDGPAGRLTFTLNYNRGRGRPSLLPVIFGAFNTATMARLVIRALRWRGKAFCAGIADKIAAAWGARVVELAKAELTIRGIDNLNGLSGRTIFVANHKSFMDFAVIPLAIGLVFQPGEEPFRPRYLAARDHFRDNPILYRVIGIGRALEAAGVIFVDRRAKRERPSAAVESAVKAIVADKIDVVMFPQGTRARGNTNLNGERVDGGYYTTGTKERLARERGHIRKGAAHMAVDALLELAPYDIPLNIAPVGITGTGIAAPRDSIRIQTGAAIRANFGKVLTIRAGDAANLNGAKGLADFPAQRKAKVDEINAKIDDMLKASCGINAHLKKRMMVDIRRMMGEGEVENFLEAIDAWRSEDDAIFAAVDCIYLLPPKMWAANFRQLYQLISETDRSREDILAFKKGIVEKW